MPTMIKQDKFTYDLRERQARIFDFLWKYAKEIKFEYPEGMEATSLINKDLEVEILEQMKIYEIMKRLKENQDKDKLNHE